MRSRLIALLLALAAIGGSNLAAAAEPITPQSGKPVPADRILQPELVAPSPAQSARVTFSRDEQKLGSACVHRILVDGKAAFAIRAGEIQTLHLAPGRYTFALEIEGGICPKFLSSQVIVLGDGTEETYRIFVPSFASPPRVVLVHSTAGGSREPSTGLQGRVENGRYAAPNGKVVFRAPGIGGPQHRVRDIYVAGIERGFLEETNELGLEGVYYTSLAGLKISPPSDPDERRAALSRAWKNFAMPNIFTNATPKAELVHQEFIADEGKEMLLALVRLPGLSGAFDPVTRRKYDAYPAVLLLIDDAYVVVLRSQFNLEDAAEKDPKDRIAWYLNGLRKRRSDLDFRQ